MSKLNTKGTQSLKYWAIGMIVLVLAWVSLSFSSILLAFLSWPGVIAVLVIDIAVIPYIVGRIIIRIFAIEVFSEKLSMSTH